MLYLSILNAVILMTSATNDGVTMRQSPYSALKSVDNDFVCAISPGFLKSYQCPSQVKCASDCQLSSPCGGFNTRENGSCELYAKNQTTFGLQHGCRYFTEGLGAPHVVLQLGPNVALNCPASQYAAWNTSFASLAVDGDPVTRSCSIAQIRPWWSVDLRSSRFIAAVQVVNNWTTSAGLSSGAVIGCYADSDSRDLSAGPTLFNSPLTIPICLNFCCNQGYLYAGVQYGNQCFCGNSYGRYGKSTGCTHACAGDTSTICGGYFTNAVYFTGLDSHLNTFNVWLSNTPPTVGQPLDKTTTTMCRTSTTAVQMSTNVFVKCSLSLPAYRYVIIESSVVGVLCLGEVMVFVA